MLGYTTRGSGFVKQSRLDAKKNIQVVAGRSRAYSRLGRSGDGALPVVQVYARLNPELVLQRDELQPT
ncbi:hypothetical protein R1flu_007290 [Riccia fluitans]|uniref:Uncharacterized protein n=1 Tax=Riccia fluitans TaxID=41844 RepID=A0ABD1YZ08_9MARC